jgi:hypothetical protein
MTVSFHKYGEYFPGTGELRVCGRFPYPHRRLISLPGRWYHEGQILRAQLPSP